MMRVEHTLLRHLLSVLPNLLHALICRDELSVRARFKVLLDLLTYNRQMSVSRLNVTHANKLKTKAHVVRNKPHEIIEPQHLVLKCDT